MFFARSAYYVRANPNRQHVRRPSGVRNMMLAHENYLSAFWTLWAGGSLKKSQMVQKGDPHKQRLAKHTGILRDPLFSSFFWFFEKSFL